MFLWCVSVACLCGVFFCQSNSLSYHLCMLGAITGSTTGVEPYSSASLAPLPSKTSPPSTTAPGHTPLLLMVRVSVFARLCPSGGQTSPSWKMADSGSSSLCPPEVLASAIMGALQAGNRLRHHARPPQQLVHIVSDCHSLLPPLTGATCFS